MKVQVHYQLDKNGRRYPIWLCDSGHWHRGRNQAVRCNIKARKREEDSR